MMKSSFCGHRRTFITWMISSRMAASRLSRCISISVKTVRSESWLKIHPHAFVGDRSSTYWGIIRLFILAPEFLLRYYQWRQHCEIIPEQWSVQIGFGFAPQPTGQLQNNPANRNVIWKDSCQRCELMQLLIVQTMGSTILRKRVKID